MIRFPLLTIAVGGILVALLSGCRSITPAVTYYTINPLAGETTIMDADSAKVTRIGIRSVELPGAINRTQMVRQRGTNQMDISPFNRWADYPDRLVRDVLEQNLTLLLPQARVVSAPWPVGFQPDIILSIRFIQLIGTADNNVRLAVDWTVSAMDADASAQTYRRALTEPMHGQGFDHLAAAHSRVLEAFCREVADTLAATVR